MANSKNLLLIGVSSGMGLDLARRLVKQNYTIYAAAPDIEPMRELAKSGARLLQIDVTDQQSVDNAVNKMVAEVGSIDVVLSNAGLHVAGAVEAVPQPIVDKLFDINVMGASRVIRAVSPVFRKQRYGRIIFTSSIVAHISIIMSGWYAASKHALKGMVTAYRQEMRRFNTEVVMIEPGQVNTGFEQASIERLRAIEHPADLQPYVEQYIGLTNDFLGKAPDSTSTVDAMEKAIAAKRAKPVYKTTSDAKRLPFISRLLGARIWDGFLINAFSKHG